MNRLAYFRERTRFMNLKERVQLTTALGVQGAFDEAGFSLEEFERHLALFKSRDHRSGQDPSRLE